MKHGFINATALVPTIGHEALVVFAANFMNHFENGYLHLMLCGRSFEPVDLYERQLAFVRLGIPNLKVYTWDDDDAPQQDDGTTGFWNYWNEVSRQVCTYGRNPQDDFDYVFASEPYGELYAKHLGAEFIPFDIERKMFPVKGTPVRRNILANYDQIMPSFRKFLNLTVTTFGSDSTGKTTMARRLAESYGVRHTAEWARPYLDFVGSEVTPEKMQTIALGQSAVQSMNLNMRDPLVFQDTDLYTTMGYYETYGMEFNNNLTKTKFPQIARATASDLYLVMNSHIPFEQDHLRYGGDKRETTDEFWIQLLEKYGLPYVRITETEPDAQLAQAREAVDALIERKWGPIQNFERN